MSSFAIVVSGVAVSQAEVGLTRRTDAGNQLVLLALLPVFDGVATILENLLLLVLLRASLVNVGRDGEVRNSSSCYGDWGGAKGADRNPKNQKSD